MAPTVVIMMGLKRSRLALRMASSGDRPSRRCRSMAKSIMMIAFFLTMPISNITPIMAIRSNWVLNINNASTAPTPADGRVEMMVMGWIRLSYRMPSVM